ncbi:hypothetical protein J5N97_003669 [Dioscorea zingiberensis]|uniref:Peptidase C1A papain C-terminal domain-containing protein n=1 Tax=Dioscorea zingiberensis TaxID=325984 RepID=A0A9D5D711_9LILI|nr:hypothetical protein J5N97_003669 [Dioscorea zingiberensis]
MRYEIFKDNLKYVDEHNAGNHTFTLALNVFADITVEEYRYTYLRTLPPLPELDTLDNENNETDLFHFNGTPVVTPDSIDWRDFGAVLPVKNQGGCCNGGIDSAQDYPYIAVYKKCDTSKTNNKVVTIDGYKWVPAINENALKTYVAKQPITTSVEGYGRAFQLYGTGVFTKDRGIKLDHVVTLIGYGTEGSTDYWLIKNS